MRLSLLLRIGLPDLLQWPHWVLQLYAAFLEREPAPEQRLEYGLAQIASIHANSMRAPSSQPRPLTEFLLFADPWSESPGDGLTPEERQLMEGLQSR